GTETSKLPEGSVIINQPLSFFREHLRLFTGILVAILVLLGTVVGLIVNIVLRHRLEKTLKNTHNYIENIIDSMPSLVIAVNDRHEITQCNQAALEESGLAPRQVVGWKIEEIFPFLSAQKDQIDAAIFNRRPVIAMLSSFRIKDETKYREVSISPLPSKQLPGAVVRVDDKSEQKKMEEALLHNEKMMSVGGLATGMAHEINNPLAAMVQNTQVIQRRLIESSPANIEAAQRAQVSLESVRKYLELRKIPEQLGLILDSGRRLREIVQNINSFTNRSEVEFSSHRLSDILDKSVELASVEFNLGENGTFAISRLLESMHHGLNR
ncbi:MAG TPA: PAS domain S-box protein, partial [Sediminispirochaeta sp.]|nr:PAS domain S-box protein [Sediminispirochaeta sp.]